MGLRTGTIAGTEKKCGCYYFANENEWHFCKWHEGYKEGFVKGIWVGAIWTAVIVLFLGIVAVLSTA